MSLQKTQSARRFQSNIQVHTKSKLINTLINQKLTEQKQMVKNRFVKLIKQADNEKEKDRPSSGSHFKVRRMSGSLKNINITMEKIKQSITYNPIKQSLTKSQQAQFIISRQYKSPIILPQKIQQVVSARNSSHLIEIKLSGKDKKGFQYISLSQQPVFDIQIESIKQLNQGNKDLGSKLNWVQQMQLQLDNQLWLPHLPHTEILLQNMQDNNQKLKLSNTYNFNDLPVVKSPTFTNHGNSFPPIITSPSPRMERNVSLLQSTNNNMNSKLLENINTEKQEIIYDFKKYNNNDFLALQKWFQKNISQAHKKLTLPQKQKSNLKSTLSIKDQQTVNKNQKQLLNLLYSIHIGGFQQLMRLHYIQAWQKAWIFQKMFWSLIRLFSSLMQQQHKINFSEYKSFQKQLKQQRLMYQQRSEKLQKMMLRAQNQSSQTEILRRRLSLAYVTYSRVNSHLCQQLQVINSNFTNLQANFNYLNLRMMKAIEHMKQDNRIKIIANQQQTTYYLIVGKNQKLQELIRIKTEPEESKKIMKKKVQQQIQQKLKKQGKLSFHKSSQKDRQAIQKDILAKRALIQQKFQNTKPVFQTRVGQRISKVEHQLNKYWLNKEQSLQVNKIAFSQLMNYQTFDTGTSTYQKYQVAQFGCQFPQKEEKSFAQFLKEQLQKEKVNHQKEIKQQSDLYVSLKDLYEQSYQKIRSLQNKNKQLNLQIQSKDKIINQKDVQIKNLYQQVQQRQTQLTTKLQSISQLLNDKSHLQGNISELNLSIQLHQRRFQSQLQNSQNLVRNNLLLKQKIQKLSLHLKQSQEKLRDQTGNKHQIQIQLNQTKQQVKQFREKYQNLDKKLQKIAPSVDKFLDFKRYDVQSIVIANIKRDLQKLFPDYFCKDSDVFLTKG